eukprot:CAMPEP_0171454102 /NCGR_PEP_ID=MMETSP0945-20130129/1529_1 /TAXON_ID=109269 /ORGANISM="Vaucheria litorea, Strain CCMP2940" /LENGTH=108 /DNA_ID=CAMNT_0011979071 /DNA_START=121 /DNA_END=444 /DNA_ORIENTATION=+
MDQPSWMQDPVPPPPPTNPNMNHQTQVDSGGTMGAAVRSTLHMVNLGLTVLMGFSAVVGVIGISNADIMDFFLGTYLLLFAALLAAYEILRLVPMDRPQEIMRKNFGW